MATWNVGQTLAAAMPRFEKTFKDQVFDDTVILNYLKENGGVSTKSGGASYIQVPLMHAKSTAQWFSGTDSLNVTPVDTLDAAQYYWRNLNAPISITLEDELNNSGKEQIVDLLDAKLKQARLSLSDNLNTVVYTGTTADKEIEGLQTLAGTGIAGGINGATYADWRAYVETSDGALTSAQMKTAVNTLNQGKGGGKVGFIVTTQTLYEKYETLLTPTFQMNPELATKETKRLGDLGFATLSFRGIPMSFDVAVPTGEMYFVNPENLKLYVHDMANMKTTEPNSPVDQHLTVRHIVMRCALGTDRRKSLGKFTGKTA